jgi:hypothetical protein
MMRLVFLLALLVTSLAILSTALATAVAIAAGFTGFPHTPETRDCPQVLVRNLYPYPRNPNYYTLMEIDVFGQPAPTCRKVVSQLNLVPSRLRIGKWGRVYGWRCFWEYYLAECLRGHIQIDAVNPGD